VKPIAKVNETEEYQFSVKLIDSAGRTGGATGNPTNKAKLDLALCLSGVTRISLDTRKDQPHAHIGYARPVTGLRYIYIYIYTPDAPVMDIVS